MSLPYSEIGNLSNVICSSLKSFKNRKSFDPDDLRHAYRVLSVGRYLSDPVSYAADQGAVADAARFLEIFGVGAHDLQVRLTQVQITVALVLRGEIVDPIPALDFFETLAEACAGHPEPSLDSVLA